MVLGGPPRTKSGPQTKLQVSLNGQKYLCLDKSKLAGQKYRHFVQGRRHNRNANHRDKREKIIFGGVTPTFLKEKF